MQAARRSRPSLLACTLCCLCLLFLQRQAGFAQPASARKANQVPRRELLQILPALAAGSGAAPGFGESGVTEPWGKRSDGSEDDIHLGGVVWEDIKVGTGASPKVGDIVAIEYKVTAVVKERDVVIDDTKGTARDFRYGIGQLIPGMDEGLRGMRTGGQRKLQIPAKNGFGRGVPAAPGRPAVPEGTPLEAVVKLQFVPGSDDPYAYGEEN